jgi:hypothetical protein
MFISKREAAERLHDESNVFRLPDEPITGETPKELPEDQDTLPGLGEEADPESEEGPISTPAHPRPAATPDKKEVDPTSSFSALDHLLGPSARLIGKPKPSYRGRMDDQVAIAETSFILGPKSTGQVFGLGPEQVSAYARGSDTGGNSSSNPYNRDNPRPERLARVNAVKERLALKAGLKVKKCLDLLDDDKLGAMKKATTISRVAKDMAIIMEKVSDKGKGDAGGIHFHVHRPEIRSEKTYDVIEIGAVELSSSS